MGFYSFLLEVGDVMDTLADLLTKEEDDQV